MCTVQFHIIQALTFGGCDMALNLYKNLNKNVSHVSESTSYYFDTLMYEFYEYHANFTIGFFIANILRKIST